MRHVFRTLVLAAFGVVACTSGAGSGDQSPRASLRREKWTLAEVAGRPATGGTEQRPYLEFAPDSARFSGSTGCNRLTGPFTLTGATIHFGPAAMTRMACLDSAVNEQEHALLGALNEADSYHIVNDTLNLARGAATLARFAATPR